MVQPGGEVEVVSARDVDETVEGPDALVSGVNDVSIFDEEVRPEDRLPHVRDQELMFEELTREREWDLSGAESLDC